MFDRTFAFVKIVASKIGDTAGGILVNVRGFGKNASDDDGGERSDEEPLYDGLGVLARPLPPDAKGYAEGVAARREDGLQMLSARDLRLAKARGNMNAGARSLTGYHGAFVNIEPNAAGDADIITAYLPYAFDGNGVPTKAHAITMDASAGNKSIVLTHGEGACIAMTDEKKVVIASPNGQNQIIVEDAGVSVSGDMKSVTGMLAGDVTSAQPVVVGLTAVTWFAQVQVALGQIAALLNVAGPVSGAPGTVTPVVAPPPLISTKMSASP